jgi:hypothetical protein
LVQNPYEIYVFDSKHACYLQYFEFLTCGPWSVVDFNVFFLSGYEDVTNAHVHICTLKTAEKILRLTSMSTQQASAYATHRHIKPHSYLVFLVDVAVGYCKRTRSPYSVQPNQLHRHAVRPFPSAPVSCVQIHPLLPAFPIFSFSVPSPTRVPQILPPY